MGSSPRSSASCSEATARRPPLHHRGCWRECELLDIRVDDLAGEAIRTFIEHHLRDMAGGSPPHSVHALGLDELRRPEVTVWSAWQEEELLGCGALKELDAEHVEIKAMRTAEAHRRKGVASRLLEHLLLEARRRHYKRVSLETSSQAAFQPARRLYERFGFKECGPFAGYLDDPNSVFMTKELHGD